MQLLKDKGKITHHLQCVTFPHCLHFTLMLPEFASSPAVCAKYTVKSTQKSGVGGS